MGIGMRSMTAGLGVCIGVLFVSMLAGSGADAETPGVPAATGFFSAEFQQCAEAASTDKADTDKAQDACNVEEAGRWLGRLSAAQRSLTANPAAAEVVDDLKHGQRAFNSAKAALCTLPAALIDGENGKAAGDSYCRARLTALRAVLLEAAAGIAAPEDFKISTIPLDGARLPPSHEACLQRASSVAGRTDCGRRAFIEIARAADREAQLLAARLDPKTQRHLLEGRRRSEMTRVFTCRAIAVVTDDPPAETRCWAVLAAQQLSFFEAFVE